MDIRHTITAYLSGSASQFYVSRDIYGTNGHIWVDGTRIRNNTIDCHLLDFIVSMAESSQFMTGRLGAFAEMVTGEKNIPNTIAMLDRICRIATLTWDSDSLAVRAFRQFLWVHSGEFFIGGNRVIADHDTLRLAGGFPVSNGDIFRLTSTGMSERAKHWQANFLELGMSDSQILVGAISALGGGLPMLMAVISNSNYIPEVRDNKNFALEMSDGFYETVYKRA